MYSQILRDILMEYEKKRDRAVYEQKLRTEKVYNKVPRIREIDRSILKTGLLMSKAVIENPKNYKENIKKVKKEIEKLKMEKAYILTENNIPLDYLDTYFECNECQDTGYLPNGDKCNCLKQVLISKAYGMSNIENVLKKENFQTFNINIFPDEPIEGERMTPRENMANITSICEGFVNNFDENNEENLLFYGSTGLGKTFMCNCIAKALLDKNKIVIYQTAFKILEIIEKRRFGRDLDRFNDWDYELLFQADLLIIDDLGTELSNAFTNAEIFNIVNTRLINNTKTIISTNLTPKEISETYTDRVFSRVLERFIPLRFFGPDLRYYRWEAK
ncbi:Chromosomal replication initiator DnaA [[Clostridium] ultunense Esp]|uniref:Chromosomal replication initiator DnaA n=1 Tax=[Clostridium] ultunense Esp TaxID=1288971 RepID=M1ZGH3_9FIRM|nr:ATP-binding protein [Schnuerera ultunensis]CCQ92857.1 Chromosomal replication initiator DnaA [[Clostridium] ultunense Esp]SHD76039.1 Chromosomal replication initiator DnaA [[Clostridium] ultunense Esp]